MEGHYGQPDTFISDFVEMKETYDIVVHNHIKIRWIDFYPPNDIGDDSDLQLLCSTLQICIVDWLIKSLSFDQQTSAFTRGGKMTGR